MDKKISLCLSGGGAKGFAHIGVYKALQERSYEIQAVSGTSAGSIVAYFIAAGLSYEKMVEIARNTKFYSAFKFSLSPTGLVSLENISKILSKEVNISDYDKLNMPLYICATDIESGEAEYFSEGPIYKQIVASCSIPMIFKPIEIDGKMYVDGGLANNLPREVLKEHGFPIVGVNVVGHGDGKKPDSFVKLVDRTIDIISYQNTKDSFSECDIRIAPIIEDEVGTFEFKKLHKLVDIGYNEAIKVLDEIEEKDS